MAECSAEGRTLTESARPAMAEDLGALARLCGEALREIQAWRGGELFALNEARPAPYEISLARDVADASHSVWVGTVDDEVFGYCVGRLVVLRDGRIMGIIEDLYVEPAARRVGVAAAMMTGLLAWFKDQCCVAVDADAMPGDRLTKNFFEAWGFTARRIVMHHSLAVGEPESPLSRDRAQSRDTNR
jgi:GNAT superfamily N-acetyltransferase